MVDKKIQKVYTNKKAENTVIIYLRKKTKLLRGISFNVSINLTNVGIN